MKMKKYFANFEYNQMNLTELYIEKETPKMYFIKRTQNIIGVQYIPSMIEKSRLGIFDTKDEAIEFLVESGKNRQRTLLREINKIKAQISEVENDYS